MSLDLTPLRNALLRLDEGLQRYRRDIADDQIRDGLIQRFEFTYEQCHKMLRRHLEAAAPTPGAFDRADLQEVIRSANRAGLLKGDWPRWRTYRRMRAKTSHTYDEEIALEVVADIPDFLDEARFLLAELEKVQR